MKEGANDYVMKDHIQRLVPVIEEPRKIEEKQRTSTEINFVNASRHDGYDPEIMCMRQLIRVLQSFQKKQSGKIVGSSVSDVWGREILSRNQRLS